MRKKGAGVTDPVITDQSVQPLNWTQSPAESPLTPLRVTMAQQTKTNTAGPSHVPFCSYTPSLFLFLYKQQGINHFLWILAPAQIFLPGRKILADIQLNSPLLNMVPSHGAKQGAPNAPKPSQCRPCWSIFLSWQAAGVSSLHHIASPSLSWSSCFSFPLSLTWLPGDEKIHTFTSLPSLPRK